MSETETYSDDPDSRPSPRGAEPDAHGQAALLLAESILHTLLEAKTLTAAQARNAVRSACEVKVELANETGESRGRMEESLLLLHRIQQSLDADADADNDAIDRIY